MRYRFGECVLDTHAVELLRAGKRLAIEPQVFKLLNYLVEARDRVVDRVELTALLWPGRPVTDGALNTQVKAARRLLGDDGQRQAIIRTVHGHGYRFVADVDVIPPPAPVDLPGTHSGETGAEPVQPDGLTLTLPARPSIVVLPFAVVGAGQGEALALGLTNDLTGQLARVRWLFVIDRGTAGRFASTLCDAREIGRRLGVRYVVRGSVQARSRRAVIHVSLADAASREEIWAERFDRKLDDLIETQHDCARLIVGAVQSEVERFEQQRALLMAPSNLDAWSAYHRGCWHMYRFRAENTLQAEHYFRRAIALEPTAPRAYAGLSFVYFQSAFLSFSRDRDEQIQRAYDLAQQSLTLDSADPLGHWALGRALLLRKDFDGATKELETSTRLNPSFALGQYSLSFALMHTGANERSLEAVDIARRLSPFDPMTFAMFACRAQNLAMLGRSAEAAELSRLAVQQPNAHHHLLGIAVFCHASNGKRHEAMRYLSRLRAVQPGYDEREYLRAFPFQRQTDIDRVRAAFRSLLPVSGNRAKAVPRT